MSEHLKIDKAKTALLIMDYQNTVVGMLAEEQRGALLRRAQQILEASRQMGLPIIYVAVRFRRGYPEVSSRNQAFGRVKEGGLLQEDTPGADIHSEVAPLVDEVVVTKRRVGAFSTTELETILRAKGVDTLVLLGITTSGVVLSTVRWASDMDYQLVVISDGCADPDEEVHRTLVEKIFPRQATVVTTQQFLKS